MVEVLPGSNPVRLIAAAEPAQTLAACDAPVSVGSGFTEISTGAELSIGQAPL